MSSECRATRSARPRRAKPATRESGRGEPAWADPRGPRACGPPSVARALGIALEGAQYSAPDYVRLLDASRGGLEVRDLPVPAVLHEVDAIGFARATEEHHL